MLELHHSLMCGLGKVNDMVLKDYDSDKDRKSKNKSNEQDNESENQKDGRTIRNTCFLTLLHHGSN